MKSQLATRSELKVFFNVKSKRSAVAVLKSLGIDAPGRRVPWTLIWTALGLHTIQRPHHASDLMVPLMTAVDVADWLGVDPETVHRWKREGRAGMPAPIQLGKSNMTRWRRSEIRAWMNGTPQPVYRRAPGKSTPAFGSLNP
jgi:predicted DNA-binding transcriptional regulator AlpA